MKGLPKRRRMAFSFLEYLLSFQRYSSFCSKIDGITNRFSTKIKNISGNIGVMLLKLGTSNVPQIHCKHLLFFTSQALKKVKPNVRYKLFDSLPLLLPPEYVGQRSGPLQTFSRELVKALADKNNQNKPLN